MLYGPSIVTLWVGLMGFQAYEGYLRPGRASDEVVDLIEPWDVTYLLRWKGQPCGFLAERLYLNEDSTGWTREQSIFLRESAVGVGMIGTALLGVGGAGDLDSLVLRLRSMAGSIVVEAKRDGDEIRVSARRDGRVMVDSVTVPALASGTLRLDLPLLGLERRRLGREEIPLPGAPGLNLRRLSVAVEEVTSEEAGNARGDREIRVEAEDGSWMRLRLDAAGRLRRAGTSMGLELESATRRVIGSFVSEREQLQLRIGRRAGAETEAEPP